MGDDEPVGAGPCQHCLHRAASTLVSSVVLSVLRAACHALPRPAADQPMPVDSHADGTSGGTANHREGHVRLPFDHRNN